MASGPFCLILQYFYPFRLQPVALSVLARPASLRPRPSGVICFESGRSAAGE